MLALVHRPIALGGLTERKLHIEYLGASTVAGLLDRLADELPALERRIRDPRGAVRRHVNVYLDGEDIRALSGVETAVPEHADIPVMAAISGD